MLQLIHSTVSTPTALPTFITTNSKDIETTVVDEILDFNDVSNITIFAVCGILLMSILCFSAVGFFWYSKVYLKEIEAEEALMEVKKEDAKRKDRVNNPLKFSEEYYNSNDDSYGETSAYDDTTTSSKDAEFGYDVYGDNSKYSM